ncbi:hypothetical protein [Clavibacter zhangzhiyongii]|uniref:hypothetical protein n=1 Tax=Clavibacter zhangzhiyongii TaxID=2768071 RepID=UPI00195B49E3|nr:hypothetical protein [Clavibacter zhangzhiyongii]MBM7024985.1 hypothetical protein [Clavibacter zhangzhiyongii]
MMDEETALELNRAIEEPARAAAEYCQQVIETDLTVCAPSEDELASTLLTEHNIVTVATRDEALKLREGVQYRTQSGAQVQAVVVWGTYYTNENYGGTAYRVTGGSVSQCTSAVPPFLFNLSVNDAVDSWYGSNGCAAKFFVDRDGGGASTTYWNCQPNFGAIGFHDRATSAAISVGTTYRCPAS